jgi:cytoskeletal protein CcmA (bactofilin family)
MTMATDKETVVGADTHISGEIRGEDDLVIKGHVDGRIQLSGTLTIDKGALVQADLDVRALVVSGTLVGSIAAAEGVRLLSSARVVGDLVAPRIMMEAGAAYRGRVDMGDVEVAASRAATAKVSVVAEVKARPAPPRMALPPKLTPLSTKAAPRSIGASLESPSGTLPAGEPGRAAPPAFPRVAGVAGGSPPAWAKKKIRRR